MAEYLIQDTTLTGIADAIRAKTGDTNVVAVTDMASQIEGIEVGIQDISTEEEMTALLVAENVGRVYRFVGEDTDTYTNGDLYEVEEGAE